MANFCGYFKENICRSCTLIKTDYETQIRMKEDTLRSVIGEAKLLPSIRSDQTGFRNKAKIVVSGNMDAPILGLLETELLDCPVHDPSINRLLHDLIPFIKLTKLEPYSVSERKGELKGIIIFHGTETYVRFVLRSKESIDRIRKHLPSLLGSHGDIASVSVNIQPVHQAVLEGEEEIFLGPREDVAQDYGPFSLRLRPQGFVQTNQAVARKLYTTAASWVKESGSKKFLELFSGQGAFSFHCAPYVDEATGIEINREAVRAAQLNADALKYRNLQFVALDAGKSGDILAEKKPDLILVNPPRRGLAEALSLLLKAMPEWIVYSSCSVESLKTDLEKLSSHYTIDRAGLFDMFPHTAHFETLVLLKRLQR